MSMFDIFYSYSTSVIILKVVFWLAHGTHVFIHFQASVSTSYIFLMMQSFSKEDIIGLNKGNKMPSLKDKTEFCLK